MSFIDEYNHYYELDNSDPCDNAIKDFLLREYVEHYLNTHDYTVLKKIEELIGDLLSNR